MHDQSFSQIALSKMLEKRDFRGIPSGNQGVYRSGLLLDCETSAHTNFDSPLPPLAKFSLKGKQVFYFPRLRDEIVARKLRKNIADAKRVLTSGRSEIVSNLSLLLAEGVPFRVYRLDILNFYESFNQSQVLAAVDNLHRLNPHSKKLLRHLLAIHTSLGGFGLPRGLSLSAALSNLLMQGFDLAVKNSVEVFFYSRYVDDIIVLTSCREDPQAFLRDIKRLLPKGLQLNPNKKEIREAPSKVSLIRSGDQSPQLFNFSYLGYDFAVAEPIKIPSISNSNAYFRSVKVDIAHKKVQRIKTRICRAFHDFSKTGDWGLLRDRVKFLTMNFSVYNVKMGSKRLAGIFHSYPLVSDDAVGLSDLDDFLRNAILSRSGRLSRLTVASLDRRQRAELLACSFVKGHREKLFKHFSAMRLKDIQKCWAY